ncbi:MAG TPA: D-alanyl-D-alanine carboxypeptidase, partial [Pirellulales bacterium]
LVYSHETTDPTSAARMFFIDALREAGVQVDGSPLTENPSHRLPEPGAYRTYTKTAELESAPLSENLRLILKVSHNLHASTLPLLLAARHGERTLSAGLKREAAALAGLGVDVSSISFGGGAGGSRSDFVTPRATVQLLRAMSQHKDFAKYLDGLPILGVDGTLAEAVDADSPARGAVQAKTGTLLMENGLTGGFLCTSKALAGYLTDAQGRKRAFAFFVNNVPLAASSETKRLGRTLGKLCEEFHRGDK